MLYETLLAPRAGSTARFLETPDGRVVSYAAFVGRARQMAGALADLGVSPGDRVLVQSEKSIDMLALYGGAAARGAVFTPLNPAYTDAEVAYFVEDAEPALIVAAPERADGLASTAKAAGAAIATLSAAGGSLAAAADAAAARDAVPRAADDLAAILYTSGTTGRSKGAMLSNENLLSNARTLRELWRFTADDVLLHALPIFHTHGLFVATNTVLAAGAAMLFLPKFDVDEAVRLAPRATAMMGVPTFYTRLTASDAASPASLRGLRVAISGSAPLRAEDHVAFAEKFGLEILERYGMTETNMITSNPYDGPRRPGSVGGALPGVAIRVTDGDAILAPGEIGVVEVRGPNVCQGYWRNAEKTAEAFRTDGWFVTGDLGSVDEDGVLTLAGREKDLIITGGLNVYPKEVETEIDALPGVAESAVFAAPHPDFGEAVLAAVAPTPGAELDPDAVIAALADRLARFKQPKRVFVVDALPRNAMGKVQKAALRAEHVTLFSGDAS